LFYDFFYQAIESRASPNDHPFGKNLWNWRWKSRIFEKTTLHSKSWRRPCGWSFTSTSNICRCLHPDPATCMLMIKCGICRCLLYFVHSIINSFILNVV
jgi:hypothetical protein